jgi:hypothetical protein
METKADGPYFQEVNHVRIKRTAETGRINAVDGGVVYVLMDNSWCSGHAFAGSCASNAGDWQDEH